MLVHSLVYFFFTYAKNIEKEIVINNIDYLIKDIIGQYKVFLSNNNKTIIRNSINKIKIKDIKNHDEEVKKSNKILLDKTVLIISITLVSALILAYVIFKYNKYHDSPSLINLSFFDIIGKNIIILLTVMIIEFLFLKIVIYNHISLEPNVIKKKIIEEILK